MQRGSTDDSRFDTESMLKAFRRLTAVNCIAMSMSRPYLNSLDREPRSDAAIQWARFLGETFGTTGALNCLRYYESLNWISPTVRDQMVSYLRGLSMGEIHNKRYDEPTTLDYPLESLSGTLFGAHAQSLKFISIIKGDDIEEHVMVARMAERRTSRTFGDEDPTHHDDEMADVIRNSPTSV